MGIVWGFFFLYLYLVWIKQIKKQNSAGGKTFYQYQLTRSARFDGKVRHISLLYLGSNPLLADKTNRKRLAALLKDKIMGQNSMADSLMDISDQIKGLANEYYEKYLIRHPDHIAPASGSQKPGQHYEEVVIDSTGVHTGREIGAEWLCYSMLERLKLGSFLEAKGWPEKWIRQARISIISRAILAASEHKTAQWLAQNSGLLELFDDSVQKTTRHHLYKMATELYHLKEEMETYLYQKNQDLFDFQDKILIYDLTNTYFEGRKAGSQIARYGKSKEKRNDCKQVVLAAVVNQAGFLKHSRIYQGNMSDPATLADVIEQIQTQGTAPRARRCIVIDAGIATEDNLEMLRKAGLKYVCVSRKKLPDYQAHIEAETISITDKRKQPIELKVIEQGRENWLYVKSEAKKHKEDAMLTKARQRFEEELQGVKAGIGKKGGTKKTEKVFERIGRIKERNKRAQKHYGIHLESKEGIVVSLNWEPKELPESNNPRAGVYFIRTNYLKKDEKQIWQIYNTIREVEATFRCLKTDLNLRPVFHQEDLYVMAHLNLGLIAYQLVAAIRHMLQQHGINYDWTNIVRIMNTQKIITVEQHAKSKTIAIRSCSRPMLEVQQIYDATKTKHIPIKTRKFVVYH